MELKWFNFPRGEAYAVPTEWREAFSLPTEWWIEAGMDRFEPGADLSYSARGFLEARFRRRASFLARVDVSSNSMVHHEPSFSFV